MTIHCPGQTATDPGEFDRLAVLTIQGGGVYGLNMLGQLATVIDHYKITPLAYARTSAGAVDNCVNPTSSALASIYYYDSPSNKFHFLESS